MVHVMICMATSWVGGVLIQDAENVLQLLHDALLSVLRLTMQSSRKHVWQTVAPTRHSAWVSLRWTHSQTDRLTGKQTDISRQTDPKRSWQTNTPAWHQFTRNNNIHCVSNALCVNAQAVTFMKRYTQTSKQRSKQEEQQACCQCYLNDMMRCCMLGV